MFFNGFDAKVRKYFVEDTNKYLVASYLIFNANYSEDVFDGLEKGECAFSYSVLKEATKIDSKKLVKIVKELEDEDGYIELQAACLHSSVTRSPSLFTTNKITPLAFLISALLYNTLKSADLKASVN